MTHEPVMLEECFGYLEPALNRPDATLVDATLGLGGHAEAFLERLDEVTVVGIDRDPEALRRASERLARFGSRFHAVHAEHRFIAAALDRAGFSRADGFLFDLGVSSMQIDTVERGFSYSRPAPLDMRMNPADELTAEIVVNTYDCERLAGILREFGEEKFAYRVARAIERRRSGSPITTTAELASVVDEAIPAAAKSGRGHPAKRTFQAIRIEVNGELDGLGPAILASLGVLREGGRLAVMTYHSLEDRIVKRIFSAGAKDASPVGLPVSRPDDDSFLRPVTRGAEVPGMDEIAGNPRARSAKLRVVEKLREAPGRLTELQLEGDGLHRRGNRRRR